MTLSSKEALERHLRRGRCRRPDEIGSDPMTGRLFSGVARDHDSEVKIHNRALENCHRGRN